jgi:hypothetical protein
LKGGKRVASSIGMPCPMQWSRQEKRPGSEPPIVRKRTPPYKPSYRAPGIN